MSTVIAESTAAATISPAHQGALQMAELGFPVFPLWGIKDGKCACGASNCNAGKHPRFQHTFKGATVDPKIINLWFKEENLNYGVRAGAETNNSGKKLVVIDVDSYKDADNDPLAKLIGVHGPLPDTAEVLTGGGGRHLYFWAPVDAEFSDTLGLNIDFKANGYVVGPGSLHASGKRYDWEGSSDLFEGQRIADLPQWIIDNHSKNAIAIIPVAEATNTSLSEYEIKKLRLMLRYITPDDYNVWVTILMALKSTGDDEVAFAIADEWSTRSDKYKLDEMRLKWSQIKPEGGVTLGTLYHIADEERRAQAAAVDTSRLIARLNSTWPAPLPLVGATTFAEYPLHALPLVVRDAVVEVQQFVQAPMAMVACSALATLSLAAQGLYDVERASSLSGPIGLYFLVVADSGERKSTLDNYFSKAVAQYEKDQVKEAEPLLKEHAANMAIWDAKKCGLADRIKRDTRDGKSVDATASELREHEATKPVGPVIPRLVYSDSTPEALVRGIAHEWPSAGLISSEGGVVFGGHGMSKDSQMRNMALINQLWDGKPTRIDRTSSTSFTAEGRLTVAIQVQAPTLKAFFKAAGDLPRGTGFLARFLVAWPKSNQGKRLYAEPPANWPRVDLFSERIIDMLKMPQPITGGRLQPPKLYLSAEAKRIWIDFYNELELQLGDDGDLHDVRDVASKAADNASRLAALFHVVEGDTGSVRAEHMVSATAIIRWHLGESQRILSDTALSIETTDEGKLDEWLRSKCGEKGVPEFTVQEIQQYGPKPLRKKEVLAPLLAALAQMHRIRFVGDGLRSVKVNPTLLTG